MVKRCACEEEVLQRIRPTPEERMYIHAVAGRLIEAIEESGMAQAMMVGSVARNTFVRGDRDLDIFLLFDPSLSREELVERGLGLARKVAAAFGAPYREKYAEHPYLSVRINALDVDLVPCYAVSHATEIQSAVDRTPFHTRYIQQHIGGLSDDVLLIKQFAKAGGVYGSDHMTEGFSGYLCELLAIYYGGFSPLLEAASRWKPGTIIDIERHAAQSFDDPLVVIDPVDPGRNVAAALSCTRMFEFVELARGYMEDPAEEFFFPPPRKPFSRPDFIEVLARRKTTLLALTFATPDYTPDTVVPQLRKSAQAIRDLLERSEYPVNRSDVCMREDRSMLLFELLTGELPAVRRHFGPPLWAPVNSAKFAAKYLQKDVFSGPYIEGGRYVVEIARPFTRARDLLESPSLLDVSLGRHVRQSMEIGWTVDEGEGCWDDEFASFIGEFLQHSSPLSRIRRR
ncbi:MAG: CCA tRNA nucleotidyltransferase [Methanomicrobiaceae archaeon]|uniref:Trna nucleotidyltransferase, archaeal type n=1 Tax=hydrocarbon metagenome TaxID=938273 RepID=A0A0W8FF61_9ZZZZ|nr:CCA tRNA nucleotidyltransferase [Methanomicrobiaceae archaeon]MDD5419392.1 CCA tRNA nucleotidyltransferase [Methanomicrobiaceae archaeon]